MCELNVVTPDGTAIASDVVYIRVVDDDTVETRGILGDVTTVHGRIIEIDITSEKAVIQES